MNKSLNPFRGTLPSIPNGMTPVKRRMTFLNLLYYTTADHVPVTDIPIVVDNVYGRGPVVIQGNFSIIGSPPNQDTATYIREP